MSQIVVNFVGESCFGDAKYGVCINFYFKHKLSTFCNNIINKIYKMLCKVCRLRHDIFVLLGIYNFFALHWAL